MQTLESPIESTLPEVSTSKKLVVSKACFDVISRQTLRHGTPHTPTALREFVTGYTTANPQWSRESMLKLFHDTLGGLRQDPPPTFGPDVATHKVAKGDTVEKIAHQHGLTTEQLTTANPHLAARTHINSHGQTIIKILPGERISIPSSAATTFTRFSDALQTKYVPPHLNKDFVLDGLHNVNSAYEPEEKVMLQRLQDTSSILVRHDTDKSTGASMSITKAKGSDGNEELRYNIAGMSPFKWNRKDAAAFAQDIPSGLASVTGGTKVGSVIDTLGRFFRIYGEALDRVSEETFTADSDYPAQALRNIPGWDQTPDQVQWHVDQMDSYNKATGNTKPFVVNGHSLGGAIAVAIRAMRPDLVKFTNIFEPPGSASLTTHLLNNDAAALNQLYKDVRIISMPPGSCSGSHVTNCVNSIGRYPNGLRVGMVQSDGHDTKSMIKAAKLYPIVEVSSDLYNAGGTYNLKTGEYRILRPKGTTSEMLAKELNVPQDKILHKIIDVHTDKAHQSAGVPNALLKESFVIKLADGTSSTIAQP